MEWAVIIKPNHHNVSKQLSLFSKGITVTNDNDDRINDECRFSGLIPCDLVIIPCCVSTHRASGCHVVATVPVDSIHSCSLILNHSQCIQWPEVCTFFTLKCGCNFFFFFFFLLDVLINNTPSNWRCQMSKERAQSNFSDRSFWTCFARIMWTLCFFYYGK